MGQLDAQDAQDAQDAGKPARERTVSDEGAQGRAQFYHAVCEAHLPCIVRTDLKSELFSYSIDEQALVHARLMDVKLLLVTNAIDLTPAQVVQRCVSPTDIERGFRVLKSETENGEPVHHRLSDLIRSHPISSDLIRSHPISSDLMRRAASWRVPAMRARLRAGETQLSPERALDKLPHIQYQRITLDAESVTGLSSSTQERSSILAALSIRKPSLNAHLNLL